MLRRIVGSAIHRSRIHSTLHAHCVGYSSPSSAHLCVLTPKVTPSRSQRSRAFHSTPARQSLPLIPFFAAILKTSSSFEIARTAARIALTFTPVLHIFNRYSAKSIKVAALQGVPKSEETKTLIMKRMRHRTLLSYALFLVPFTLFWATLVASLEKTPLTGRWRTILLSPEEEEEIAAQLEGPGWYKAVGEILSEDGPPRIIPSNDWRYAWVNDTLRKLEATIPVLVNEPEMYPEENKDYPPMPPPAEYPLRPRPRASEYLRSFCERIIERKVCPMPHSIPGPPYSLLVVEKPDASNAFSYGFGPYGGGGIVVYSGFLDDVMSKMPTDVGAPPERSWWSTLFGGILSRPSLPSPHPTPTPEQTTEIAILLAHELSHLVLSHHLESLSSANVIIPGTISMAADIVRVVIFPITMIFGPFVNDALAQLGKVGSGELTKMGEWCTSQKQEIEADVVSARILAHAGFDAREAVKFWETRAGTLTECATSDSVDASLKRRSEHTRQIMGRTHPVHELRVKSLREELARWETERQCVMDRLRNSRGAGSVAGTT